VRRAAVARELVPIAGPLAHTRWTPRSRLRNGNETGFNNRGRNYDNDSAHTLHFLDRSTGRKNTWAKVSTRRKTRRRSRRKAWRKSARKSRPRRRA